MIKHGTNSILKSYLFLAWLPRIFCQKCSKSGTFPPPTLPPTLFYGIYTRKFDFYHGLMIVVTL